jgi:Zn-dependent M16 (insulinase) family peptidase
MFAAVLVSLSLVSLTDVSLDGLVEGTAVRGFTPVAVYLDDDDKPVGARFVHKGTGFVLDYLKIESAPQGFIWVNTFPTSDKGEPHTQEHLLLGKGDRGRRLGSDEAMELAESSAFTDQWRTCYHFNTVAGHDVFWRVFEGQLDALLNPDYTDDEIRREVRNFGTDKDDAGNLKLEEKGTVYNEMVRTYENPDAVVWRAVERLVYGRHHPLAYESGGTPEAIRTMTAADIRAFHDANYHLANMGMVAAFPSSMKLGDVLDKTSALLASKAGRKGKSTTEADLPKPQPASAGAVEIVPFPSGDDTTPGPIVLAWQANQKLSDVDRTLRGLFLDSFAGDESTPLYQKLVDGKSRVIETGANAVGAFTSTDQGEPVQISLGGVKADKLDDKTVEAVRALVLQELAHIASLKDGDPELGALKERIKSRVVDSRRNLDKYLDTPPGFGFRGTGSDWINQLHELNKSPGFQKSLTWKPVLKEVERVIGASGNPFATKLKEWGLLDVPYGVAAKPSPKRRAFLDAERKQRIDAELARLERAGGGADEKTTLTKVAADEDRVSADLEAKTKATPLPPLVDSVPMTLDPELKYDVADVDGMKALRATFDSMASTQLSLAFRVDGVPESDLLFLAILPAMLSSVGIIEDGKPISSDVVRERLRREVLALDGGTTINPKTGRAEMSVTGAGNTVDESKNAIAWMNRVLFHPDWRPENLQRIRDVIDQDLTQSRQRMLGAEETWVLDPRDAWWQQSSPIYLHMGSFLTRTHDLLRLKWMFAGDPKDTASNEAAAKSIEALASKSKSSRAELTAVATSLAADTSPLIAAAGRDLSSSLAEIPDGSLAVDWSYLVQEIARDLRFGPVKALAKLESVRAAVVSLPNARLIEVGSSAHQQAVQSDLDALVAKLAKTAPPKAKYSARKNISERLRDHDSGDPLFVGLVSPGTSSGVFANTVPGPDWLAKSDDQVLNYLASETYSGHGAHSMFMKTWAAGLAYSNGLHPSLPYGTLEYYAERCPLLPQTLRFVIDELKKAKPDANIARYAVSGIFASRVAEDYESRASSMAGNYADGLTPEVVRGFREHVLKLANDPHLDDALATRMPKVYGPLLPGFGKPVKDGVYFVIGPESQLAAYQDYLKSAVDKGVVLHRLYPRDYWIVGR